MILKDQFATNRFTDYIVDFKKYVIETIGQPACFDDVLKCENDWLRKLLQQSKATTFLVLADLLDPDSRIDDVINDYDRGDADTWRVLAARLVSQCLEDYGGYDWVYSQEE